jgi:signal peptidase I
MNKENESGIFGTLAWLAFSLAMGFLVWGIISNQNSSYKTYLVQSGSMEPAILVGDVIVVNKIDSYAVNDVITFNDSGNKRVTHRIVEIKNGASGKIYSTKGDANRSGDRETLPADKVIGKVILTIPKLGYVINFLKTTQGFVLLVVIPAVWIVISELLGISKKKN